MFTNMGQK